MGLIYLHTIYIKECIQAANSTSKICLLSSQFYKHTVVAAMNTILNDYGDVNSINQGGLLVKECHVTVIKFKPPPHS